MSSTRYRSINGTQPYIYADIQLELESNEAKPQISIREFKLIIMTAIESLFGDFGSKTRVDVLKYSESHLRAIIRSDSKDMVFVRNALTLFSNYNHKRCVFLIHKICHSLCSLSYE